MSQRPSAPGYLKSSQLSAHQRVASTGAVAAAELPATQSSAGSSTRGFELPPLLRVPPGIPPGGASPSGKRAVTLPSVLNPVVENDPSQRRRKADEVSSSRDEMATLPPLLGGPHAPGHPGSNQFVDADRAGRKVLTPKSPIRRAISLSHINPANGSINAQQNPFPSSPRSRSYMVEQSNSGAPPMLASPAPTHQTSYGYPNIVPPPSDLPRRLSPEYQRYSASPSPGYSGYDENSPTGYSGYDQASGYLSVGDPSRSASRGRSVPAVASSSQLAIPVSTSAGQSTYQMMTLKTTEGDVRFPVDVQAASRVADEKRKRNAGASARFRERRKKKEMEAASTISKLEQQVKEVSEDAEFYKKERDVLASIVRGISGGDRQLSARPTSPRLRRRNRNHSTVQTGLSPPSYSQPAEATPTSPDMDRRVRRRTSSFPMAQASAPTLQSFGPGNDQPQQQPQQHVYSSVPQQSSSADRHMAGPLPQPIATTMLPPTSQMPSYSNASRTSTLPPPPSVMQAPPMTGPYNPFAVRYDAQRLSHMR